MNAQEALKSFDRNGVLGELTGADAAAVERFFRKAHLEMVEKLDDARLRAAVQSADIYLDAYRVSGVNTAEQYRVTPRGDVFRVLETFPDVFERIKSIRAGKRPASAECALESLRPLLLRAAYNGLWSPSGTNWQPIRVVEVTSSELSKILSGSLDACGVVVLARKRYDSILADVAGLCGLEQGSCAEWIDLGIWEMVAHLTALSHGWFLRPIPIEADQCDRATEALSKILQDRMPGLCAESRKACRELLGSLNNGDHYPVCVMSAAKQRDLCLDDNSPGGLKPSDFDRLVESRCTQRVASPSGDLAPEALQELFLAASKELSADGFVFPVFGRNESFPMLVGKAMHAGLEGPQGLLERASLENFRFYLQKHCGLNRNLSAWTCLQGEDLETEGRDLALPCGLIPKHLKAKLQEVGHFKIHDDVMVDRRGRTLSPVRLMKLVKLIAKSFGQFFLSFHNTHPLLGVLLAKNRNRADYIQAGRIIAYMSLQARAKGFVSIIKTGPLEIAGKAVSELLIEHHQDPRQREELKAGKLTPVLTFQLGLPLGPFELVSQGLPSQHDGLSERRLDRRAPRAALSAHYIPAEKTQRD